MLTRVVLKKGKFYQGFSCSFMNLLKMSTFRSIFQTFDHISDRKFKAVSLNSSQQKFLDFVIYFLCETYPKWAKGGGRGAFK